MKQVRFLIQGERDYIDIAQISYRILTSLGVEVSNPAIRNFSIRVLLPVPQMVYIQEAKDVPIEDRLAEFEFDLDQTSYKYVLTTGESGLPESPPLPEPHYAEGEHWDVHPEEIRWKKSLDTAWPVFFAFMLMGRLSGIHFFGSKKPRGVSYQMKRIPLPHEMDRLWVKKLRGPIKGFGVILLGCGDEVIGSSSLKI